MSAALALMTLRVASAALRRFATLTDDDRRDIAQDVSAQAIERMPAEVRGDEQAASSWVYTAARFAAIAVLRGRRGRRKWRVFIVGEEAEHTFDRLASQIPTPLQALEEAEALRLVRVALDEQRPEVREAIRLFYDEGRSVSETARMLRRPLLTVQSMLTLARAAMRRRIEATHGDASFGEALHAQRVAHNLEVKRVAATIGINRNLYRQIETGQARVSEEVQARLVALFPDLANAPAPRRTDPRGGRRERGAAA